MSPIIKRVPEFEEGLTFIIENVFVDYASVFKPNTRYRPEWAVVIRVPQQMVQEFYEVGFRLKQDANGLVTLRAKRYVRLDDGTEMAPPSVVDCENQPWPEARGLIGNGSRCNVKVRAKYTEYQGVWGLSCYLEGLQVLDHVPYVGGGAQFGEAQGTTGGWSQQNFQPQAPPQQPGFAPGQQPAVPGQPAPGQQFVPGQQVPPPQHQAGGFVPGTQAPQQQQPFQPEPSQMPGQQDMAFGGQPAPQQQQPFVPGQQVPPPQQPAAMTNPHVPEHMQQGAQDYVPPGNSMGTGGGNSVEPGNPVFGGTPGNPGQAPQVPQGPPQGGNVSQPTSALGGFNQAPEGQGSPSDPYQTSTGDDVPF